MKKTLIPIFTIVLVLVINCNRLIGQNAITTRLTCDSIINTNQRLIIYPRMPEYPGGQVKMHEFINDNLIFPTEQDKLTKNILVVFQINAKGHIEDICVYANLKNINSKPLGIEVIRVFRLMPDWIPAEENGIQKPVQFHTLINIDK